ncbi:hypothetical protein NKU38_21875, partial [Bacillus halotolerans]|nr:hypothetical protein [Bacillus halotolerans]
VSEVARVMKKNGRFFLVDHYAPEEESCDTIGTPLPHRRARKTHDEGCSRPGAAYAHLIGALSQNKVNEFHRYCTYFGCEYIEISNGTLPMTN